ncbi:MAG: class I SAM-dependent methyltransferase [Brevundimonas sp.]|jgi:glutathione S-transferase|uniref:class I SAM-dependent methyltransferase n=1 Tax=Brevundimonas sp. TaxID=1871086 RepID=UPI002767C6D1|nr:class I SAM-dependent methyltransferase [Brevundimonas sp.]MDP3399543.1 class I SAM-dependent methyltransferase [Brevundimonas sp.]MDZ4109369.1 class I SAM-dependent methyltransferase [Brevundimonas sp.]
MTLPLALTRWIYRRRLAGRLRPDATSRFGLVFHDRRWESAESASGPGSERASEPVRHTLEVLERILGERDVHSIADVACGDFNWMPMLLGAHPRLAYVGYDVVPELVRLNRRRYPHIRFETLDITRRAPERADLVLCKDLLNHLDEADVHKALRNMVASGARYLLITSNRDHTNVALSPRHPHGSRHLNLQAPPYSLPEPLEADHYLALWETRAVAEHLAARA